MEAKGSELVRQEVVVGVGAVETETVSSTDRVSACDQGSKWLNRAEGQTAGGEEAGDMRGHGI